jgi:hypothetical protein
MQHFMLFTIVILLSGFSQLQLSLLEEAAVALIVLVYRQRLLEHPEGLLMVVCLKQNKAHEV